MAPTCDLGPKALETRARLLASARRVFEAKGYGDTRVRDVTEGAGVSHGTFYTYFDSKQDVFRELADELRGQLLALQDTGPAWEVAPERILRRAVGGYVAFYQANALLMAVLEQVAVHDAELRRLRLDLRRAVAERAARFVAHLQRHEQADPGLDARYAASALTGMVDRFAFVWFVLGEDYDEATAVDTLTRLWYQAVCCRPAPGPGRRGPTAD